MRYLKPLLILSACLPLILLLLTLLGTSLSTSPVQHFDTFVQLHVHALTSPTLTRILLAFTWLGAIRTFLPAVVLILALLLLSRNKPQAFLLGGAVGGAFILNESLKLIVHRPRPVLAWSFAGLSAPAEHTFSFPSGHALFAVVLYGALALIALHCPTPPLRRFGLIALALFMALVIGLSRIYFGMHYPSDVLGGYLAGTLWLFSLSLATQAQNPNEHHHPLA